MKITVTACSPRWPFVLAISWRLHTMFNYTSRCSSCGLCTSSSRRSSCNKF